MSTIRPLERDDLAEVADLYEIRRSGARVAPTGMADHLGRLFLDAPTYDPELPSLVATDGDGRVNGFLGACTVPMVLDGERIRTVVTGPLFTRPESSGVAVFLLRRLLSGPQAMTFADRGNQDSERLLMRLGARVVHPRYMWWTVAVRPVTRRALLLARGPAKAVIGPVARMLAGAVDGHARLGWLQAPVAQDVAEEPLTPSLMAATIERVAARARVRPWYDEPSLAWRLEHLRQARMMGVLHARALRDAAGTVLGWYVMWIRTYGTALVVQMVASEGAECLVVQRAVAAAHANGAVVVQGRLEPEFRLALRRLPCTYVHRYSLLVATRDDRVRHAFESDRALLTVLDGELWTSETFGRSTR